MSENSDEGLLAQLSATARRLANDMPGPLRRITVQLDGARVELEWEEGARDRLDMESSMRGLALAAPLPAEAEPEDDDPCAVAVRSPVVGTFYRAPAPGEPPFVAVGGAVGPDTVIGIVEAMKLMNRITAGSHGTVRSVLLSDGSPVEFDQPLVLLDPLDDESTQDGAYR